MLSVPGGITGGRYFCKVLESAQESKPQQQRSYGSGVKLLHSLRKQILADGRLFFSPVLLRLIHLFSTFSLAHPFTLH